jgi:hypothetical protein
VSGGPGGGRFLYDDRDRDPDLDPELDPVHLPTRRTTMTMQNLKTSQYQVPSNDETLLDELDRLVAKAADGDSRAVGAIAIAFGPTLLEEARKALGPSYEQDDADVMQTFFLRLMEGTVRFPRIRGAAIPWMKRRMRALAREHIEERGPGGDLAG